MMGKREVEEMLAKQTGYSLTTLKRVKFIREAAENKALRPAIRKFAKQACERLDADKNVRVMPLYEALKAKMADVGWVAYCEVCDKEFNPLRPDAFYCSNACRQKAYRERS
jgi:hypothetical protein